MTYTPVIYAWRTNVVPIDQVFRAGGQAIVGGMTLGGASYENQEPGGRAELIMNFAAFATPEANLNASWTVSRITNGTIMRIRLQQTVQLVSEAALGMGTEVAGVPWSNDQPWANGQNWLYDPQAQIHADAAKGASSFSVDLSSLGQVLSIGHVVGFHLDGYDFAHIIMDISYDASDVATVTVEPPLRRALTVSSLMKFRPTMLVTCVNAREVMGNFTSGRHMALNTARFVEALV